MSKLEELIQHYCSDGVEWKTIEELTESLSSGLNPRQNFKLNETGATCFYVTVKEMASGKIIFSSKTDKITQQAVFIIQNRSRLEEGDILLSGIGTIGRVALVDIPTHNWNCSESVLLIKAKRERILPKFLKYILEGEIVQSYFNQHATGSTLKGIRQNDLKSLEIPVPPLPVQEEIVRILDNFSLLSAELEAELEGRRKQYDFYRNQLLSFDSDSVSELNEGRRQDETSASIVPPSILHQRSINASSKVEWKKLGEICTKVCSGGTPTSSNKAYYQGNIPWLRTQEVDWTDITDTELKITEEAVANSSAKLIPANCVIVAMYGATAAKAAINKIPLTTNQACCNLEIDANQALYRYVFHWLGKEYQNLKSLGQGSQSNLSAQSVKNYPIPVPSLSEQQRIVDILDRFDAICNDLSQGLPAEIEARKKQYEYYRDKLLTFKRKGE